MGISIGLGRAFLCKQISCADAHFPITSKLQSSNNSFILITLAFIGYGVQAAQAFTFLGGVGRVIECHA